MAGQPQGPEPMLHPFAAHRPAGHVEGRAALADAQGHEQAAVAIDHVAGDRPHGVGVGQPRLLPGHRPGEAVHAIRCLADLAPPTTIAEVVGSDITNVVSNALQTGLVGRIEDRPVNGTSAMVFRLTDCP